MNTWFTADCHFYHANIIIYCNRPWMKPEDLDDRGKWKSDEIKWKRTKEMNDAMIERWNAVVAPKDNVYIAGDFLYSNDQQKVDKIVGSLHGNKFLVTGDHDSNETKKCRRFKWVKELVASIKIEGQPIILSHWSFNVWGKSHYGSYNLYGHSHGRLAEDLNKLSFDIGVDSWDYMPVSFDQVKEKMSHKTFVPIDKRG